MFNAVTLLAGVSSITFDIGILEDDQREGDETFDIVIATVSCGDKLRTLSTTTVTIVDNDREFLLKCSS